MRKSGATFLDFFQYISTEGFTYHMQATSKQDEKANNFSSDHWCIIDTKATVPSLAQKYTQSEEGIEGNRCVRMPSFGRENMGKKRSKTKTRALKQSSFPLPS